MTKLTRHTLRGIWHALIVPWTDDDQLDESQLRREIQSFVKTGMHGMYTGGTTGEFYAQDDVTFEQLTAITCEEAHTAGFPVQIGCTALSTRTVRHRVKLACRHNADAIQLALPFWMELQPEEALAFLHEAADAAGDIPLILYHTGRSKRKLAAEELAYVAGEIPTLIGAKDTGCDLATLRAIVEAAPDLAIFGGDHDLVERMEAGGRGGYCSVTGLNARLIVAIYNCIIHGQRDNALLLQDPVAKLITQYMLPLYEHRGLRDSTLDRMMRVLGGGNVGLQCQAPYRSAVPDDVEALRRWCEIHAPTLLNTDASSASEFLQSQQPLT